MESPRHTQKSHINTQKSPTYTQKSLIYTQKSPIYATRRHKARCHCRCIGRMERQVRAHFRSLSWFLPSQHRFSWSPRYGISTTHCDTLQHTATHCNTLQHTATHYHLSTNFHGLLRYGSSSTNCNKLQHTATFCHRHAKLHGRQGMAFLRHIATHCNTLQHTATHCNTLQHTAIAAQIFMVAKVWQFCITL